MKEITPAILVRRGKKCGNLGNENMYYDNMLSKPKKKPGLADVINR